MVAHGVFVASAWPDNEGTVLADLYGTPQVDFLQPDGGGVLTTQVQVFGTCRIKNLEPAEMRRALHWLRRWARESVPLTVETWAGSSTFRPPLGEPLRVDADLVT